MVDEDKRYRSFGKPLRVIDGDTVVMMLDLGFYTYKKIELRLLNVDTHELNGDNHRKAVKEKKYVQGWFSDYDLEDEEYPFYVYTLEKPDSFGRYLGDIWTLDRGNRLVGELKDKFDDIEWEG